MAKTAIARYEGNKRSLYTDSSSVDLVKMSCKEFGKFGEREGEDDLGFVHVHHECRLCDVSDVCMFRGFQKNKDGHAQRIKEELGLELYFDESRVYELANPYMEQFTKFLEELIDKNERVDKLDLLPKLKEDSKTILKTLDPAIPLLIYKRVMQDNTSLVEVHRSGGVFIERISSDEKGGFEL